MCEVKLHLDLHSKLENHYSIKIWRPRAEESQTPALRWSKCALKEPQIGSLACGLKVIRHVNQTRTFRSHKTAK